MMFVGVKKPHMFWIIYNPFPLENILVLALTRPLLFDAPFLPSSFARLWGSCSNREQLLWTMMVTIRMRWFVRRVPSKLEGRRSHQWTWKIIGIVICGDWKRKLLPIKFACLEIEKRVFKSTILSCHYWFPQSGNERFLWPITVDDLSGMVAELVWSGEQSKGALLVILFANRGKRVTFGQSRLWFHRNKLSNITRR